VSSGGTDPRGLDARASEEGSGRSCQAGLDQRQPR